MDKKTIIDKINEIRDLMIQDSYSEDDPQDGEVAQSYVDDFADMLVDFIESNWEEDEK